VLLHFSSISSAWQGSITGSLGIVIVVVLQPIASSRMDAPAKFPYEFPAPADSSVARLEVVIYSSLHRPFGGPHPLVPQPLLVVASPSD